MGYDGGDFSAGVGSDIAGMKESLVSLPSGLCVGVARLSFSKYGFFFTQLYP